MNLSRSLILGSSSPRRQFLMKEIGFDFIVKAPDIDESFPKDLAPERVPAFLAENKASVFRDSLKDEIVMTADTVVILDHQILNKPANRDEAINMLSRLSGKTHRVTTAVCLLDATQTKLLEEHTQVTFRKLSLKDIEYYVDNFKPFDKAGSYGAQECLAPGVNPCSKEELNFLSAIGKKELIQKTLTTAGNAIVAIDHIDGSYFNVMGLPIQVVYRELTKF